MRFWKKYLILLVAGSLIACTHKLPPKQMSSSVIVQSTQKFSGVLLASELPPHKKAFLREFINKNHWLTVPDIAFSKDVSDITKVRFFLNSYYSNINNIWAIRGGYGSYRLIDILKNFDFKYKKNFIGYSDLTALNIFLSQKTNWRVIHGPMVSDLQQYDIKKKSIDLLIKILDKDISYKFKITPIVPNNQTTKNRIEGSITGGNLTLVENSIGTAYEIDTRNKIVFLEDTNITPEVFYRSMYHLIQANKLNKAKAVVIGSLNGKYPTGEFSKIIALLSIKTKKPFYITDKIGHGKFNFPIIYNSKTIIKNNTIYLNCK